VLSRRNAWEVPECVKRKENEVLKLSTKSIGNEAKNIFSKIISNS